MWLAPPAVAFPESPTTGDPANWRRTGSANYVLAMRSHPVSRCAGGSAAYPPSWRCFRA